jgi:hypothetical protein
VTERRRPSVAAVISFIDCINRGDIEGLGRLMSSDHKLVVFDEPPLSGRGANIEAWRGYAGDFPSYVIYPHRIVEHDNGVAVLGHTTGSHLGLPDKDERKLTLIWLAEVDNGMVRTWRLIPDTTDNRRSQGLDEA